MKINLSVGIFLMCLLTPPAVEAKDGYPKNADVDILHYSFHITLNDSTNRIEGSAVITLKLTGSSRILNLDLTGPTAKGTGMTATAVVSGNNPLTWLQKSDHLVINLPDTIRIPATISLTVTYSGIPSDGLIISNNRFGERTFFGDNWPDRAHHWLPCIDHPSDKATVEFLVTAPKKYRVVSNGYLAGEYPVNGKGGEPLLLTHWVEDVALPTKVMVIGVADFAWTTSGISRGIPVQTWVFPQNREAGFIDYQPAAGILTFYQDLVGPYSFEKLANVQSKTMFGGMENSGCIFYYEGSVTGKNRAQSLLAHEIAHQWFGDAVTENDWHHVWLSEGFATYLEAIYADSLIPGRSLSASMADMKKDIIRYYEATHKPVIDTTITNKMDLLSTNSYQKGAWVLHMLRYELGDQAFWTGIRTFYAKFRDKNAMTSDFQSVMEMVSGKPLDYFFRQWLEVAGQPVLECTWKYNDRKKKLEMDIVQVQEQHVFTFSLPVEARSAPSSTGDAKDGQSMSFIVKVNGKNTHLEMPVNFPVEGIRLDPGVHMLFQEKMVSR
jgi:aminopeptidase N